MSSLRKIIAPLLLSLLLLVTSCAQQQSSRFEQAQQESTQQRSGQAVVKNATQGAKFNQFFPESGDGYQRVFTSEKKGFAQAKLKKEGKDIAVLSINDTSSNPSAADKYKQASKTISGYPAVEPSSSTTALLVGNRYQVKIQSRDASFSASDREAWLQKFDLNGIDRLK